MTLSGMEMLNGDWVFFAVLSTGFGSMCLCANKWIKPRSQLYPKSHEMLIDAVFSQAGGSKLSTLGHPHSLLDASFSKVL